MQLFLVVALVLLVVMALAMMVIALLSAVAIGVVVGIPIYVILRHWSNGRRSLSSLKQNSLERLQHLYVEGRIDLFEFERRVARLIAVEH